MSIRELEPIVVDRPGGAVPFLDPIDVPPSKAIVARNVLFAPGSVKTRPGLVSALSLSGGPSITGLGLYSNANLVERLLILAANGNLYRDTGSTLIASGLTTNAQLSNAALFNQAYLALGDGKYGVEPPRRYNDSALTRMSPGGPGAPPQFSDDNAGSKIVAGVHKCICWFETADGFWTKCSPPGSYTAPGGKGMYVYQITSPVPNAPPAVARLNFALTAAGGENYYHVSSKMSFAWTGGNFSWAIDFSDDELLSGDNVDYLFNKLELAPQAGVLAYGTALIWWGERTQLSNWVNLGFDGGSGANVPWGWTLGSLGNTGGSLEYGMAMSGGAYKITGNGSEAICGNIYQTAYLSQFDGTPLIEAGRAYTVRARLKRSAGLAAGTVRIQVAGTGVADTGLSVAYNQISASVYNEFSAELISAKSSIPSDLRFHIRLIDTPTNNECVFVDDISISDSSQLYQPSLVRKSEWEDPDSYDGVKGILLVGESNGQAVRNVFNIRRSLFIAKEDSLFVTSDDGVSEFNAWVIDQVSETVGTPSVHGVAGGETWKVIASKDGLYYLSGSAAELIKLSALQQGDWDRINWSYGHRVSVAVDLEKKRIYVSVPLDAAATPSHVMTWYYAPYESPIAALGAEDGGGFQYSLDDLPTNILLMRGAVLHLGNSAGNGKLYQLTDGQRSDDGLAINSVWRSAYLSSSEQIMRNWFGHLSATIEGQGTCSLKLYKKGEVLVKTLRSWTLASPSHKDEERIIRFEGERLSVEVSTNAVNEWFDLCRLTLWAKVHAWAAMRTH